MGNAIGAQAWRYAHEFNQPLIPVWKTAETIIVQILLDDETNEIKVENLETRPALPTIYSLLSSQDTVISDLYRNGDRIEAVVLNYDPIKSGVIQIDARQIILSQSVFTLMLLSLSSLEIPSQ